VLRVRVAAQDEGTDAAGLAADAARMAARQTADTEQAATDEVHLKNYGNPLIGDGQSTIPTEPM
jgi:hypothetical protein